MITQTHSSTSWPNLGAGRGRRGRDGHDDASGLEPAHGRDGGLHRRAGREPVVHQDHGAAAHLERRAVVAIEPALCASSSSSSRAATAWITRNGGFSARITSSLSNKDPSRRDGAHRQLLVARHAQLADHEDVERGLERLGDFEGDGHAAARQGQYQHVRATGVRDQLFGEFSAGLGTISEWCQHGVLPLSLGCVTGALKVAASWKRSPEEDVALAHRLVNVHGRLAVGGAGGGAAYNREPKFGGDARSQIVLISAGRRGQFGSHAARAVLTQGFTSFP